MVRSDNIKVKFLLFLWTINLQEIAEELKTKKVETKEWPMNVALKKVVKIKKKYHHIKWIFKKVDFDLYSVISWKPFCPHSYFLPFKGARRLISFFKCTNKYPNMDLNPFVSAEMPAIKRIRLPKWMYMEIFVCAPWLGPTFYRQIQLGVRNISFRNFLSTMMEIEFWFEILFFFCEVWKAWRQQIIWYIWASGDFETDTQLATVWQPGRRMCIMMLLLQHDFTCVSLDLIDNIQSFDNL